MNARTVRSQEEFDQALAERVDKISIDSPAGVWLTIGDTAGCFVTVTGESRIEHCSGRVGQVTDSGRVGQVTGSGSVEWVTGSGSADLAIDIAKALRKKLRRPVSLDDFMDTIAEQAA